MWCSTARAACSSAGAPSGPEHVDATHVWQMPQGGIDEGEDPYQAALRELYEETNIRSVEKLGEIEDGSPTTFRARSSAQAWKGKYRGQTQKWYALRFTGDESEIDIAHPAGGHKPEFVDWRWEPMDNLPDLIVPFKRKVYEQVVQGIREIHETSNSAKGAAEAGSMRWRSVHRGALQVRSSVLELIEPRDPACRAPSPARSSALASSRLLDLDARTRGRSPRPGRRVGEHRQPLAGHLGKAAEDDDAASAPPEP